MSWSSKLIFAVVGVVFMLRGGLSMVIAFWRLLLPLVLIGGGIYLVKGFLQKKGAALGGSNSQQPLSSHGKGGHVIEICPHCLQEVGSCPKCRRS